MIADLKPYPAMKDSGVEWLGEVPEHWEVRQLGRIGAFSKGNGGTKADEVAEGVPCVRYGDLYTRHRFFIEDTKACVSLPRVADYTPLQYGDVLFAGSGETIEEIGKSAVNLLTESACCGGDVVIFRPAIEVEAKFLGLATDCPQAAYQKSCMGRGITVMHIYGDELKYLFLSLPPLPEQAAIVRYLDYVDRRVRRLVRAKRKLIALLTEQKQAIIHRAVTRGLDPDVPLKDSGVEWLGKVPEHWEVRRLRSLARVKTGGRDTQDRIDDGEFPFFVRSQTAERINSWSYDGEAVLTAGDGAGVAKVFHYVNGKFDYHQRVYKFSHFKEVLGKFFFEYLRATLKFEALAGNAKSTVDSLRQPMLLSFPCLLPPTTEQGDIVDYLHQATADIETAIYRAEREIELLNEYRTRLIADVVTGKLDVRDAAAALPEIDPLAAEEDVEEDDQHAEESEALLGLSDEEALA